VVKGHSRAAVCAQVRKATRACTRSVCAQVQVRLPRAGGGANEIYRVVMVERRLEGVRVRRRGGAPRPASTGPWV
jgi:hypothetical protein